jgi:hypothetical protein
MANTGNIFEIPWLSEVTPEPVTVAWAKTIVVGKAPKHDNLKLAFP